MHCFHLIVCISKQEEKWSIWLSIEKFLTNFYKSTLLVASDLNLCAIKSAFTWLLMNHFNFLLLLLLGEGGGGGEIPQGHNLVRTLLHLYYFETILHDTPWITCTKPENQQWQFSLVTRWSCVDDHNFMCIWMFKSVIIFNFRLSSTITFFTTKPHKMHKIIHIAHLIGGGDVKRYTVESHQKMPPAT